MTPKGKFEGLEQWDIDIEEVAQGWFRTRAVRKTGNLFEESRNDPEGFVERLCEFELGIQNALEVRKARG